MLGDGLMQASITIGNQRAHLIILSLRSLKGLLPLVLICLRVCRHNEWGLLLGFLDSKVESNCCKFMLSPPFAIVELDLQ